MIPRNQIRSLLSKGFIVATPEYRLCPQISLYDGPIQDAKDVLKWCQEDLPALMLQMHSIEVDSSRVVAMGHSAGGLLALITGECPNPPRAIVDFYGCKYLSDPSWTKPQMMFTQIPDQPQELTKKVFEGSQVITTAPMFIEGKPNLSDPRCAWYIQQLKDGTSISSILGDGVGKLNDPLPAFTKRFPPTYFLHGKLDVFVDYKLTERAHEEMKQLGVETELVLGEDIGHVFDIMIEDSDAKFEKYVVPALEFLARHV